ncbi:hypothetical protein VTO42DRAFT_3905 [Malbranchea cinnamomea]
MTPGKWDDEEEQTAPASPRLYTAPRRRFDDEEESDEVLDSWDAAEDSEAEREKAAKAAEAKAKAEAEAAAQKKSKAQRIKEHQERRKAQKAAEDDDSSEEDEAARRARLKATEKESDLKHAEDLIGDIDLNQKRSGPKSAVIADPNDPTKSIDLGTIPLFRPATKQQFQDLTSTLIPLLTAQSKKPQYALWVQDFARQLVKDLPSADIKKVASALTTAGNEKLKEEKAAEKGGKKSKGSKKATLVGGREATRADLTAYDDVDDLDDDDFM